MMLQKVQPATMSSLSFEALTFGTKDSKIRSDVVYGLGMSGDHTDAWGAKEGQRAFRRR